MGKLVPINPSIRANGSFTTFVNAALNLRCLVKPSYFETTRGDTIRRAQCRHNIAIGSPVAMSGTMQSRQKSFLQRWHCFSLYVGRTRLHMPHSSLIDYTLTQVLCRAFDNILRLEGILTFSLGKEIVWKRDGRRYLFEFNCRRWLVGQVV